MTAELRHRAGRYWVVDLSCGIEEQWGFDQVGAEIRATDHNDNHHRSTALDTEDVVAEAGKARGVIPRPRR